MSVWLWHWQLGWYIYFTETRCEFSCDVWCVLISVLSWFMYLEPEKHLTLSITSAVWSSSGSIFDLPAWLMSSPECNVIPCLTLSPNFTPFFLFTTAGVHVDFQHVPHALRKDFSSAAFLCHCVWILTPTPNLPDRSRWAISALQRRWRLRHDGKSGDDARWA